MNYNDIKRLVENKLVNKTETRSYEELSELILAKETALMSQKLEKECME